MILPSASYHRLRRLHSLSGVFPLAVFLVWHIAVNFTAVLGADGYDRTANAVDRLPLKRVAEVLVIGVPIVLHVVVGALLGNTEGALGERRAHMSERLIAAQRISAGFLVVYVLFHVWSTRFSPDLPESGELFAFMSRHLANPGIWVFNALGLVAASTHLGVGLYDFAHQWGLAETGARARVWARGAAAAAALLATAGMVALVAFR
jgi:succinate dehydrogenase / fumarate reductase cytochrome b subunit